MINHENIPIVLYRNKGKEGLFAETFLNPLNIRKPEKLETIDFEEVKLDDMLAEAYRPQEKLTEEIDIIELLCRHKTTMAAEEGSKDGKFAFVTLSGFGIIGLLAAFQTFL